MITHAWKLGNTGYYFARRGDAVDTVRNTYSKVATVTDYDQGKNGKLVIEAFDTTFDHTEFKGRSYFEIPLTEITIHDKETHL